MKIITTLILVLFLSYNLASAQDTLYIYRAGVVVTKRAVSDIDSVTFSKSYTLPIQGIVTDIDGNVYHTIKIGSQTWMVEDLKTKRYSNGDLINSTIPITKELTWENNPNYQWAYDGIESNVSLYGRLYTWYAATDVRKIAPIGWHVSTDADWTTLQNYLIANGYNYDGINVGNNIAKSLSAKSFWLPSPNEGAIGNDLSKNNASGFSSTPGGYRGFDGMFYILNWVSDQWTSTESSTEEAWMRSLRYTSSDIVSLSRNKKYGFSIRCVKDTILFPTISTLPVTDITFVSAISGGKITDNGGSGILASGVCWDTKVNPTILNNKTNVNGSTGIFSSTITGLMADSTYYVRDYATNIAGTAYGNQIKFKTLKHDTLTISDIDGNDYHTIKIGNQTWMVENLKTTRFNDSTPIPIIADGYQWINLNSAGYSWYNGNSTIENKYGALYNWYAVNSGKLAPVGWHVPTQADIKTLAIYLGGYSIAGSKLKESGNEHWYVENGDATNASGFTALPGGYRSCETGDFHNSGIWGVYWASGDTLANGYRYMMTNNSTVLDLNSDRKNCGFSVRCIKDTITAPVINTLSVKGISYTSAVCGGKIISDGGAKVTAHGICWSTTSQPGLINIITFNSPDSTVFTNVLTGLASDSTYYVRAFATNSKGTSYGEQVSFKTLKEDSLTITDIDGNVYHTVTIGTQVWLKENLKVTKFSNGDLIPNVSDNAAWSALMTGGYCWYNNEIENKSTYGALYNWYAVDDSRLIAPAGWHVATDADFTVLTSYLGGESTAGNKLKEVGLNHWLSPNNFATNESGFTALPGGLRSYSDGTFRNSGSNGYYWSTTQSDSIRAWDRELFYDQVNCFRYDFDSKHYGFSVRCVRDEAISLPAVLTMKPTAITDSSVTLGGSILNDGRSPVSVRGICWSNSINPTITNSKTSEGSGIGAFSSTLTRLMSDSTYYARAYATNGVGTSYGEQVSFTTRHKYNQTTTDIDGNVYHTVTIGTQTWMAENLKTTRFNDSIAIPLVTDQISWAGLTTPGYCWYNNDSASFKNTFGGLYNWYAVNTGKLAPIGWHVATDDEWETLTNFLGYDQAGGKLKVTGTINWTAPNAGATNETNFSALPGGGRGNDNGTFDFMGKISFWWTSTVLTDFYAKFRSVGYNNSGIGKSGSGKANGLYVRCIKD